MPRNVRRREEAGQAGGWCLGLAVAGTVMIALPLALGRESMNLPPAVTEDTEGYRQLVETAALVDRAFASGDPGLLASVLSEDYLDRLQRALERSGGRPLDGEALGEQGALIGGLDRLGFLMGRSEDNRVVLAYDLADRERDGGYPVRRGVFALRFVWDGSAFRLDARKTRDVGVDQTAESLAERMVAEMLGG